MSLDAVLHTMKLLDSDSGDIAHPRSGDIAESKDGSPLSEMEAGSFLGSNLRFTRQVIQMLRHPISSNNVGAA